MIEALASIDVRKNSELQSRILNNLGTVSTEENNWLDAEQYFRKSLDIKRALGRKKEEGPILTNLGLVYSKLGRAVKARKACEEGVKIARSYGDLKELAYALKNLGDILGRQQQWRRSEEILLECLALSRQMGNSFVEASTLKSLSDLAFVQGNTFIALQYALDALKALQFIEDGNARQKMEERVQTLRKELEASQISHAA